MSNALRLVAVKRGIDPKDFALVAFGGAGPLHAVAIAEVLGIPRIIIPLHPGHCSAFGALISDWRVDRVLTRLYRSDMLDVKMLNDEFTRLTTEAVKELQQEGFSGEPTILRSIDMRYQGQNYEHEVLVSNNSIDENEIKAAFDKFAELYEAFSGFSHPNAVIELVNLRVTAIGDSDKPKLVKIKKGDSPKPVEKRPVFISQGGFSDIPIYRRTDLPSNKIMHGPSVIEEVASTTVVPEGYTFNADENGILIISREDIKNV
jgi:N-methylhydantoinase A/oxoprolinase/acetone carboxylase beta subunit